MEKRFGFSLAEALITMLIVCIIAVASAPIITKKLRKSSDTNVWNLVKAQKYIYPDKNRDIMLGSPSKHAGIIVNGVLVFKNTKGQTIGWISEDGTSSFAGNGSPVGAIDPEELDRMVKMVTESMSRQNITKSSAQSAPQDTPSYSSDITPSVQTQPGSQELSTKQLEEMGKSMNIDFGALLKGLQ